MSSSVTWITSHTTNIAPRPGKVVALLIVDIEALLVVGMVGIISTVPSKS
jgi:hypothetical protein